MIKSSGLLLIVICLMVGIVLGLVLSGWTPSLAAEGHGGWSAVLDPTRLGRKSAVGEAVPSAAHLSLWEIDFEVMLPMILKNQ